jgi:hypothetical protein
MSARVPLKMALLMGRVSVEDADGVIDEFRAEVLAADGQAYDGELAMLRGLVDTLRVVVQDGSTAEKQRAEVRRLLHQHAGDDAAAREEATAAAATATPELTVYRAEHPDSGITLGHYGASSAARAHCEAVERRSWPVGTTLAFDWIEDDEDRVAELVVTAGQNEESTTGYTVTALELASEYDEEADE